MIVVITIVCKGILYSDGHQFYQWAKNKNMCAYGHPTDPNFC
jgi:hypothetical protein